MRRVLVVAAILVLAAVAWSIAMQDDADDPSGGGAAGEAEDAPAALEPARAPMPPRQRTPEEVREEAVSAFLAQWPEIGQDREQDPALAAVRGQVLRSQREPVTEGVVETSRRGAISARARVRKDGTFFVKNVPPGHGVALVARAPGYAPGGADKLVLAAGETLDVGALYLGSVLDPDVTNRVVARVVRTPEGKPVAGVQVTATSTLYGSLVALGEWEKQPGGTVVRETTGDDGVAVFKSLPPGSYDFFAEADGLTFEVVQRALVQCDTQLSLELALDPALAIEGKVVDQEEKPVANARVVTMRWGSFTMHPAVATDAEGKFKLDGLSPGRHMVIAVREDLGEKQLQNVEAGTKDLVVPLVPGAEIMIRVLDAATEKPVTAYSVRPFQLQPFAYLYSPRIEVRAADGVWKQLMSKQTWGVEVSAPGYAQKSVPSIPLPQKDVLDVKLDPAGVVHGRVVAKDTGKLVRAARVFLKRGGFPPTAAKDLQTVTDEKGEFVLDGLPIVSTTVWISHVDHSEQSFAVEPKPRAEGALPPAEEFALGEGGRIVGHAFGPGRAPLAGQTVTVMKAGDFLSPRNTKVAADGSYELRNVPPDTYRVSLGGGFGGEAKNNVVVAEGAVVTVDFGTDTGGQRLGGKLVRADQTPAAGVAVQLEGPSSATQQATSDAQGRFAFENLAPGSYRVRGLWGRTATVEVTVKAEEPPAEVVLTLQSASIEGRVLDAATGQPISGAWVDCEMTHDAAGAPPEGIRASGGGRPSDGDGGFRLGGLEAGRYRVRAYRDPYGTDFVDGVTVAPGETKTGVEVRLASEAGVVVGTVKNAAGAPLEGASLHVRDAQGRRVFLVSLTNTSTDGTYSQGQLKPGEYDVAIEKDGFAPSTQRVLVEAGKSARADFTLLQGGRIEVTARVEGAGALANASVTLLDASGRAVQKGLTLASIFSGSDPRTDAHGQITMRGVAAGSYTVKVRRDDGVEATRAVDVVDGASAAVEVVFPAR